MEARRVDGLGHLHFILQLASMRNCLKASWNEDEGIETNGLNVGRDNDVGLFENKVQKICSSTVRATLWKLKLMEGFVTKGSFHSVLHKITSLLHISNKISCVSVHGENKPTQLSYVHICS